MADQIRLSVPGKPEYLGLVRVAVASAANAAGFSVDDIDDITIAVSEVCTHIFCSDNTSTYEVTCEVSESGMTISIDDTDEEIRQQEETTPMVQRFCLPVTEFIPELYDPSICMIMLRALMDEVDIFSRSQGDDILIRMIKNL